MVWRSPFAADLQAHKVAVGGAPYLFFGGVAVGPRELMEVVASGTATAHPSRENEGELRGAIGEEA